MTGKPTARMEGEMASIDQLEKIIRERQADIIRMAADTSLSNNKTYELKGRMYELNFLLDQITNEEEPVMGEYADDALVPWDVWEWWNYKVGMKPGRIPGKEAAATKRLIDNGLAIGDLDRLWDWMKQDPWYAEKGIDLPLMAAAVLKWRAADAVRNAQATRWDGHR